MRKGLNKQVYSSIIIITLDCGDLEFFFVVLLFTTNIIYLLLISGSASKLKKNGIMVK